MHSAGRAVRDTEQCFSPTVRDAPRPLFSQSGVFVLAFPYRNAIELPLFFPQIFYLNNIPEHVVPGHGAAAFSLCLTCPKMSELLGLARCQTNSAALHR